MYVSLAFWPFFAIIHLVTGNTNHPMSSIVWDGVGNLTKGVMMHLIQTGLGIASEILGKCGEDKAKAIVDVISNALPDWYAM